jgi:putative two-component system hydrogenase maturation factor HypX/HoxX
MRILLISTAYNCLTQRAHLELIAQGHEVSVELSVSDEVLMEGVALFQPELIICPFLKDKIPEAIWRNHVCIIVHPGIKGDRGPSSMDWAILNQENQWGVTAIQAGEVFDAGDIWATREFNRRPVSKGRMYRHEVMEAGIEVILMTVKRYASGTYVPEQLDYTRGDVTQRSRPSMPQEVRRIDWLNENVDTIIRKIYSADNQPGVLDTLYGEEYYLYGAHREKYLLGEPGQIIAKRDGAICRAAVDGAVWISHLRKKSKTTDRSFKLPATMLLGDTLRDVPDSPLDLLYTGTSITFNEIWYKEENSVGYLSFDFHNGAMDTGQCERLRETFQAAARRPTKVIVLSCGMDFWSNGIHLNVIEAAENPGEEAWQNINAMNDLVHEIITNDNQLIISAMLGNASAGGVMLALAADYIYVRTGIVLNPHYKTMGLYGSEYWTYLLPKRVGLDKAVELTEQCLPISTEKATNIGMIDGVVYCDGYDFYRHIAHIATQLAHSLDYKEQLKKKRKERQRDEENKPLSKYRDEELKEMEKCFYDPDHIYPQACGNFHQARHNFVYKIKPSRTPSRLAIHRATESCAPDHGLRRSVGAVSSKG